MAGSISAIVDTPLSYTNDNSIIGLCDSTANALSIESGVYTIVRVFAKSGRGAAFSYDLFGSGLIRQQGHIRLNQVAMSSLGVKVGDVVTLQKERNQYAERIEVHPLAEGGWKHPDDIIDDYVLPYYFYKDNRLGRILPLQSKPRLVRKGDTFSCTSKNNPSILLEFKVDDIEPGDYGFVTTNTTFELGKSLFVLCSSGPPIIREKKDVNPSEDTDPADSNTEIELGLPIGRERENGNPSEATDPTDNGELVTQIRDLIEEINDLKRRVALLEEDKRPNKSARSGVPTDPISSPAPVPVDDND